MTLLSASNFDDAETDLNHLADVALSQALFAIDRLGRRKRTVAGALQYMVDSINSLLSSQGYSPPVAYAAGIPLTGARQTVFYSGQTYAPNLTDLPFTTSGTFETTKFRLVTGLSSADLALPTAASGMGYRLNAVGAAAWTLANKLDELGSVSPTDFMSQEQRDLVSDCTSFPDVTAAIQAAFDRAAGTYGTRNKFKVVAPRGGFGMSASVNANISTSDTYCPSFLGAGSNSTCFKAVGAMPATAPLFKVTGGSPGKFFRHWADFHLEHLDKTKGVGIELQDTGGFCMDRIQFDSMKVCCRMTTTGTGGTAGFSEFNTLNACSFLYDIRWGIEYNGNSSFHGSGFGAGCVFHGLKGDMRCVKVTKNNAAAGDPQVYGVPFNVTVFGDATTILWEHEGNVPARLAGRIEIESDAAITLGVTAVPGVLQVFQGEVQSYNYEPVEGSMLVIGNYGLTAVTAGSNLRFTNRTAVQDVLFQTGLVSDVDGAAMARMRWRSPGGSTNSSITAFDLVAFEINRAGTNTGAAGGCLDIYVNGNNAIAAPAHRVRVNAFGDVLFGTKVRGGLDALSLLKDGAFSHQFVFNTSYGGSGKAHHIFQYNGGVVGSVTSSPTGAQYNTTSDYRLKGNVVPMDGAAEFARLKRLNPVRYTWNLDGSPGEGYLAHEFGVEFPHCVTGKKDAVDAKGNPIYQAMDTSGDNASIVASLVYLGGLVANLQAEVAALKAGQ